MKRIRTIILLMAMMFAWTLSAQVDTIVTASGELGNSSSDLEFLNESGGLTHFPRLSDAGELLYYPPLVTTDSVTNITSTSAAVYGNILFNGWYENVQEQGFQLSTTADFSGSVTTQAITPDNPYADCELPCVENIYSFIFTGLTSNTTYYVRAYATNSAGTAYGNEVSFTTTTPTPQDGQPCPNTPTLTDIDGNTYNTVQIGSQCWMKQNLRTTKYADGTSISQGIVNHWNAGAGWCYPNGNVSNKMTYGLLYNRVAVMRNSSSSSANPSGVQGICPTGWHVPSDAEWTQLTSYVSSQSQYLCENGYIAKALASTTGWYNSNASTCSVGNTLSSNNATGFDVRPAGRYHPNDNSEFGYHAYIWSSTDNATNLLMANNSPGVLLTGASYGTGYSVRCLRDEAIEEPCSPTSSTHNIEITTDQLPFAFGDTTFLAGTETGTYILHRTNAGGCDSTITLNLTITVFTCGTSTLSDIDGNVYNTVQIGSQCWMKQNLRTTKYADGTSIPEGIGAHWNLGARWCRPSPNSNVELSVYGFLYNREAVMRGSSSSSANPSTVQGICPDGWHVPSDAEWTQLTEYVSSQSEYVCGSHNGNIAKALASTTTAWISSANTCAVGNTPSSNNATGFDVRPAGTYGDENMGFGYSAMFWSTDTTRCFTIANHSPTVGSMAAWSYGRGYSVRCVKD